MKILENFIVLGANCEFIDAFYDILEGYCKNVTELNAKRAASGQFWNSRVNREVWKWPCGSSPGTKNSSLEIRLVGFPE